MMNFTDLLVM